MAGQYGVTHPMLVGLAYIMSFLWLGMVCNSPPSAVSSRILRQHLNRLNRPAIRTTESPDGDMIDCVLISQQPALDHPLLKDHKIQMQPAKKPMHEEDFVAEDEKVERRDISGRQFSNHKPEVQAHEKKKGPVNLLGHQLWHQVANVSCPEGTIPIRRTTKTDLLRNKSRMHSYGRKFHHPPKPSTISATAIDATGHQHAIGFVQGGKYYGAKANINVWNPSVQVSNEFSLSQIWILGGSFNNDLNSIEAGWQVSPDLYGDHNTRLFTYWTVAHDVDTFRKEMQEVVGLMKNLSVHMMGGGRGQGYGYGRGYGSNEGFAGELSRERPEDHRIDLVPGSSLPNRPPFKVSAAQQKEIMSQINELLEKGLIQVYSVVSTVSGLEH
ncbi:hypothetical protein L7F22_042613 [Adiantum nelumboides]|nr:hypothetical protein [Adiantum nelumboides]